METTAAATPQSGACSWRLRITMYIYVDGAYLYGVLNLLYSVPSLQYVQGDGMVGRVS